jgi:hypothetical protein
MTQKMMGGFFLTWNKPEVHLTVAGGDDNDTI